MYSNKLAQTYFKISRNFMLCEKKPALTQFDKSYLLRYMGP